MKPNWMIEWEAHEDDQMRKYWTVQIRMWAIVTPLLFVALVLIAVTS